MDPALLVVGGVMVGIPVGDEVGSMTSQCVAGADSS